MQANQKRGSLRDWLGEHIGLSLVGPALQAGIKGREAGSLCPSPDPSGPMATEVEVWLPGWVAADLVGLLSYILSYFTVVCLYTHSLKCQSFGLVAV